MDTEKDKQRGKRKEQHPVRMRPYEKFTQFGVESLTESELLAVILRTGSREEDVETLASHILQLAGYGEQGLSGLHHISMEELLRIKGIGRVKAIQLKCVMELCTRMAGRFPLTVPVRWRPITWKRCATGAANACCS